MTGSFLLSSEIKPCDRKFLPGTEKFLAQKFFQGHAISAIFHPSNGRGGKVGTPAGSWGSNTFRA